MKLKDEISRTRETKSKNGFGYFYIQRKGDKPDSYIGEAGDMDLTSVVYGYSVGYKDLYEPFLPRIIEWLSEGIETRESFDNLAFHQRDLNSALAFATWIKTGKNEVDLWKNTLVWQEQLQNREDYSQGMSRDDKEILALSILRYIQAQEYEKAIQLYQSIYGDKPFKLNSNMSGLRLAYAYCLHFYEGKFTIDQLEKSARPFLEKHLVMLYTMGRSTEMLYWLKTVCDAREKEYTPEEVIYTFYEYIPEEEKPDFVKELLGEKEPEKKSLFSQLFKW
ncbi:hypothetical protein MHD_08005 [Mannheimia granulomatis]|uniref:Uncharacterized protein n=1 Tax=Mannheimia granulomatis TaxID=85402 RepID=A0A011P8E2_9PAST|nr:hypothetical protein [Mannheimia granulomatis]EXI62649.1 hypothetical protein AK33_04385 [Mannheimia granulomatis]RGE47893.1 hypothetical protein MHD_08005 [Mannheimia granulomatis]